MSKENIVYEMIDKINDCYKNRDIEKLRNIYDSLFSSDAVLIGTSPTEVCFTKESIINLFNADFKGWGDFQIKKDSLIFNETAGFYLASFKSDLSITFENRENVFSIFKHVVKENDDNINNKKTASLKNIWLLQHILKNRDDKKRSYIWELDFHMIVNKDSHKISLIHFAYPFEKDMYDIILGVDPYDDQMYIKEVNMFQPNQISDVFVNQMEDEYHIERVHEIEVSDEAIFIGVGAKAYTFDFDVFYKYQMLNIDGEEESLFHLERDLVWGLLLDSLNPVKTPFRIIGIRDKEKILHQIISYPYQIILENKSRREKTI